ncbi:MAG: M23 family metallopeptidase [Candidatus Accumulibacter sp. UW20]|jgi:hypothetical protein
MHRLFVQFSIILSLCIVQISVGIAACLGGQMNTGWCWPTKLGDWSTYLGWHGDNPSFDTPHLAQDIKAAENDPVYAVANGLVLIVREDVSRYGGAKDCTTNGKNVSIPGAGIVIRHYTSYGDPVDVLYAHLKNVQVKKNDTVEPGDVIGYIRNYTWCGSRMDHLHFGVAFPGRDISVYGKDGSQRDVWPGYAEEDKGFINPVLFFSDHSVGNTFSCDPIKERCSFRVRDSVGWFPPVDSCDNATQWYIVGKTTDGENYLMGSSDRSVCRRIPVACYPN